MTTDGWTTNRRDGWLRRIPKTPRGYHDARYGPDLLDGGPRWSGDPAPPRPTRRRVAGEWDNDPADWQDDDVEAWLDWQHRRHALRVKRATKGTGG